VVAVAGPLGRAAAGLALLAAGLDGAAWAAPLLDAQRRPQPPYDAGPEAAGLGATAMIDVSDGLLADLGHVAAASGVLIDVSAGRLAPEEVLLTAARAVAAARRHDDPGRTGHAAPAASPDSLAADALSWVLAGGEDHALIATFPPGTALPARWTVIGAVREGLGPHGAPGVTVDGRPWAGSAGWDHFAASG
jgi:thiamine-monophosphate kinase